jgi:hypothetical protein
MPAAMERMVSLPLAKPERGGQTFTNTFIVRQFPNGLKSAVAVPAVLTF